MDRSIVATETIHCTSFVSKLGLDIGTKMKTERNYCLKD